MVTFVVASMDSAYLIKLLRLARLLPFEYNCYILLNETLKSTKNTHIFHL